MATQYTFARLTAPRQFMPEDEVTFKLEYSEDLVDTYATLVVDGYSDYWPGTAQVPAYHYGNYTQTHYVVTSLGNTWDVGYEEYVVPANSLGITPPPEQPWGYWSGKARARVEFRRNSPNSEDPMFVSNSVPVNIIFMWETDLKFDNTPYVATTSTFAPSLKYTNRESIGEYDAMNINSYRFYLYDSNYNLIQDTGELYDWNSYIYVHNDRHYFTGLLDQHTYYVRAKVTLNGGYVLWRGFETLSVDYAALPHADEELHLSNTKTGVEITMDLTGVTHDRVVINRAVVGTETWLEIRNTPHYGDTVDVTDHYAITKQRYMYRAIIYNGNEVVDTYYNYIDYVNNNIVISDSRGSYVAVGDIECYPISKNDRGKEHVAMDSKYPYFIINGDADYDSGVVNAVFAEVDDECKIDLDNHTYSEILRDWLNNGQAKLLTYYTGESWIVGVSGIQTVDPQKSGTLATNFNWIQIGDAKDIANYPEYGLVVNDNA